MNINVNKSVALIIFHTFGGEVGSITAQHSQGIMWWERGFADGCDEGITGGHQAKSTTQ